MIDFNTDIQSRIEKYLTSIVKISVRSYANHAKTPDDVKEDLKDAQVDVKLIESKHDGGDPQDYISNDDTCWSELKYRLTLKKKSGTLKLEASLKLPYMMQGGMFIIDGKPRIATNNLNTDYDCSYIPEQKKLQVNQVSYYAAGGKTIKAQYSEEGVNKVSLFDSQEMLEELGLNTSLDEDQKLKLMYLVDTPFDERANFTDKITYEFLKEVYRNKSAQTKRDSVANLKIDSTTKALIDYLWSKDTRNKIMSSIKLALFPNKDTAPSFAIGVLMTYIMRFFRRASDSGIDIATVVNPLVFDQLHNKVKMPEYMPYTQQFRDLIDAPNTPENGNVNIINELNVCIYHNDTDGIGIHCYSYPKFEKVDVKYNVYINEYSLRNDEWDYENGVLLYPDKPKYKVNYHTYTVEINREDLDKVKYIEPKVDDKFSISSRTIPFLNSSDSVRVAMGASMAKQAIELENAEVPLVASGNTEVDSENSTLSTYANEDGIVTQVDGVAGIKYDSGVFQPFPRPISGMNHITITHKELVSIGDRVKRGQKITSATAADGAYKIGCNANVFYLNYLGLTYEDGVVVSESFAKKMTHWTLHDVIVDIYVGDEVTQIANYGDKVSAGDILLESISNTRTVEGKANPGGSKEKNDKEGYMYLTNDYEVPNNIFGGIIVDASYESNPSRVKKKGEDVVNMELINNFLEKIKNPSKEAEENVNSVPKKYRNQRLGKTTRWSAQNKYGQSLKGRVRFKIAVERPTIIGDKYCNRYGSKGMISCIIPDDCRPYYTDKNGVKHYADIVANPASIVGRMNVSQLHESLLSRCIDYFYEKSLECKSEDDWNVLLGLIHTYYGAQHKDLTVEGLKAMKDAGRTAFAMNVGTFIENSYDFVTNMARDLGIKEDEEVYAPSVSIHERKDYDNPGASGLELRCIEDKDGNIDRSKEFKDGRTYELGWLDQPIVVGVNYYLKLFHSAVWSGSVTPSRKSRASKPIMGSGKIRFSGQSMGEMEKWQLQATGASELYMDPVKSPSFESSQYELINTFLRGGFELS